MQKNIYNNNNIINNYSASLLFQCSGVILNNKVNIKLYC